MSYDNLLRPCQTNITSCTSFVLLKSDVSEEVGTELSPSRRSEKMEDTSEECENTSSSVAFENLKANVTDITLILIVENVSGLSSDAFQVEVLQDFDVAVVTFPTHVGKIK